MQRLELTHTGMAQIKFTTQLGPSRFLESFNAHTLVQESECDMYDGLDVSACL